MFWNKKKPKSKPQIKTTVPKTFKAKEPPPRWQPTFGETKKKDEKPPEVTTKSEPKIDWEDKFLKSFQKLTYRHRAWDVWRDYILLHACSMEIARSWRRVVHDELINMRKEKGRNIAEQFEEWDHAMDNIYFDEETGQLMQSVTVPGGDVIQIPYEKEEE